MTALVPNTALTPKPVDGVTYFSIEGAPQKFFRCEPYRATVSIKACADRWRAGQLAAGTAADRFEKCRGCAIGAAHAGAKNVYRSPLFGMQIDPRTRRWSARLIFGRLGVSSYNREREFVLQRNAKNRPPTFRLEPRRLAIILDGKERIEIRDQLTADSAELVVAVLRTAVGRVAFTRGRPAAPAVSRIEFAMRFQSETSETPRQRRARRAAMLRTKMQEAAARAAAAA